MQKYQIIPRRFRPARFSEVVGQEALITLLKNALKKNRLGQAYLFCGPSGCGKTTLARLFAKALNCLALTSEIEPCNACANCLEIAEGKSLDLFEIDGASNRGIDDIRKINETVKYASNNNCYKIYLIDEVHMLTKEAFNALLKTLEEPPSHVKFFFATTEPHKVLPTITSRCQRFDLRPIPEGLIVEKLKKVVEALAISVEEKALACLAQASQGSLRVAESFLDQLICLDIVPITLELALSVLGLVSSTVLAELDRVIQASDLQGALALSSLLLQSGKEIPAILDALFTHFQACLEQALLGKKQVPYSKDHCLLILDLLIDWQHRLTKTHFKDVYLNMLFVSLARSKNKVPLDALIQRLISLEEALQKETHSLEEEKALPPSPSLLKREKESILKPEKKREEQVAKTHPAVFDTLIRFAAVELEGSVNKGGP